MGNCHTFLLSEAPNWSAISDLTDVRNEPFAKLGNLFYIQSPQTAALNVFKSFENLKLMEKCRGERTSRIKQNGTLSESGGDARTNTHHYTTYCPESIRVN